MHRPFALALRLALVIGICVVTVATAEPLRLVRGEVVVTQQSEREGLEACPEATLLLLEPGKKRGRARIVDVDEEGRAGWPYHEWGYPLVVAHAPERGLALSRPGYDQLAEREHRYKAVVLGNDEYVARISLHVTREGHGAALELDGVDVVVPGRPWPQWLVFAASEGGYLVEWLDRAPSSEPLRRPLPDGFVGEVFAVWGGPTVAPGATTPRPVGVVPPTGAGPKAATAPPNGETAIGGKSWLSSAHARLHRR